MSVLIWIAVGLVLLAAVAGVIARKRKTRQVVEIPVETTDHSAVLAGVTQLHSGDEISINGRTFRVENRRMGYFGSTIRSKVMLIANDNKAASYLLFERRDGESRLLHLHYGFQEITFTENGAAYLHRHYDLTFAGEVAYQDQPHLVVKVAEYVSADGSRIVVEDYTDKADVFSAKVLTSADISLPEIVSA